MPSNICSVPLKFGLTSEELAGLYLRVSGFNSSKTDTDGYSI